MRKKRSRKIHGPSGSDFDLTSLIRHSRSTRRANIFRTLWRTTLRGLRTNPRLTLILLFVLALGAATLPNVSGGSYTISCHAPRIIDGDTFECDGERIRLAGIDAPELPGHCRPGRRCTPGDPYAAQRHLDYLTGGSVECRRIDTDKYGRTVARCRAGQQDLSCAMIASGHAVRRYSPIVCF